MDVHVLGVSGTPREQGATNVLVQAALLGARAIEGVTTEFFPLAGKTINPCNSCGSCRERGGCVIEDDMQALYPKLLAADAIIVGTPVYFGSPSALCKAFMERVQGLGTREKRLRLKVGGGIATASGRNGGQETALLAINLWCHINDMLPVGITAPASQWGVTAQASSDLEDIHEDVIPLKVVKKRILSKEAAWMYGRKLAVIAKIIQTGIETSGLDLPDRPYGWVLPDKYPEELYQIR